jgi:hypothetical protein
VKLSAAKKPLQRVTLEMSLKPFKSLEIEAIESVCVEAIRQWLPLIGISSSVSVLLWVADGSEILVWDGDLKKEMEWAKYIGFANEWTFSHIKDGKDDPKTAIPYTEHPVRMTYGDLKTIIAALKKVGSEQFGLTIEVGATFDAGPEFAYSDFKYKDHPEINRSELGGAYVALKADYTVVCTWSELKGDGKRYAAYPGGIPEGTPFGQFFGKQCASFIPALGFDYIWFSNGFALSYFPWTYLGANYNGAELALADYEELSGKVMSFWDMFKQECPNYRTEIRGTNFGTGMDLAKDCIPLRDLYRKQYVEFPPPNSPWGALNYDFGLEMAGYMSRIAVLPGTAYPYRFYPNDPWFWQNPWTDLYDREPHDIYCPLTVARLNERGVAEPPRVVELLTIDTEKGDLPEATALEVSAHIRRALQDFPDKPGLLTWIYPFDELHDAAAADSSGAGAAFFNDWFIRNAINEGFPLNTVISSGHYRQLTEEGSPALDDTVLVTSTFWLREHSAEAIAKRVRQGGKVLLYGPIRDAGLMELLNVAQADGIEGECRLTIELETDTAKGNAPRTMALHHRSMISHGAIGEVVADPQDSNTVVRAVAEKEGEKRVFALYRAEPDWNGGAVSWVRGSLPYKEAGVTHLPVRQDRAYGDSTVLARLALQDFGYTLLQSKLGPESPSALLFISRRHNGFQFTGCKQDTSVQLAFRFPDGVPLLIGQSAEIGDGAVTYSLDRTFRDECRIFVDQRHPSIVSCREVSAIPTPNKRFLHNLPVRKLVVSNLNNAKVTLYPPVQAIEAGRVEVKHGEQYVPLEEARRGNKLVLESISGSIEITW